MPDEKQKRIFESLKDIEERMPQLRDMMAGDTKSIGVGPRVIAPLAEAILVLAREVRELRDSSK